MQKSNNINIKKNRIRATLILLLISFLLVFVLSMIVNNDESLVVRLSNNFFIVSMVFLMLGVVFQISAWLMHKKHIRNMINKEEIESMDKQIKDPGIVLKEKKESEYQFRKKLLKVLWRIFITVGTINFALSLVILYFM